MRAWSAFSSTDINGDNEIDISELRYLIFAFEGEKPNDFRIVDEMKTLDKNKSGTISREEWMSYLCLNHKVAGKSIFRISLRQKFGQFDKDKSGTLNYNELKSLV